MIKVILEKLLEFLSWKVVVVCLLLSVVTFAAVYQYIGPFSDDHMVVGAVGVCFAIYASIAGLWVEWKKRADKTPKPRRRRK